MAISYGRKTWQTRLSRGTTIACTLHTQRLQGIRQLQTGSAQADALLHEPNMTEEKLLPPYPRMGEIYRTLALAFDTKARNRDVDRYARDGDVDWRLPGDLVDELFFKPLCAVLDAEYAGALCQSLICFYQDYISLVSSLGLDGLLREQSLPVLIESFLVPHGASALHGLAESFGGPDLARLLDSEQTSIAAVFAWLSPDDLYALAKAAYPASTGADRTSREMVFRWIQGKQLPDLPSIRLFLSELERHGSVEQARRIPDLRRWLMTARAIDWLERNSDGCSPKSLMLSFILSGMPAIDTVRALSEVLREEGRRLSELMMHAMTLNQNLKRAIPKEEGAQERTRIDLEAFDALLNTHDPDGRTRYGFEWFKGRWEVFSGNLEAALPHYRNAVTAASYRAGTAQKEILTDALALAAALEERKFLASLKHQAIALGILAPPPEHDADVVQDWEIEHLQDRFHAVFPLEGLFPEADLPQALQQRFPVLLLETETLEKRVPDLRNPDRVVTLQFPDGQKRRWPQIRLFASFGRADALQELLEKGADVDKLDAQGGSALLCAIQHARQSDDRRTLDALLSVPHKRETLDSLTTRKQISPMFEAIDYGEPDVVENLLRMGANPELRGNIIGDTPLYYCMSILGRVRYPTKMYQALYASFHLDWDVVQQETMRRYGVAMVGVFGEKAGLDERLEDPRNREIYEKLVSAMVGRMLKRHSIPKLIRIAELLLEYGANPNAPARYPIPGRTPMMLAAEDNSGWAFDLMIRHGGDPFIRDSQGSDCLRIAHSFRAAEVVGYMRSKGIM